MKFKKYIKESAEPVVKHTLVINEDFTNPDAPSYASDELYRLYRPVEKMIEEGRYEEAKAELDELSADLDALEERNKTKRFFKYPQYIIDAQRKNISAYRAKLPTNESIDDMDKRCDNCNTLLTDAGECPKCDLGEEDYGDEIKEELSNKEKLKIAYPELNFEDKVVTEEIKTEELSVREKLKAAYPELNFDGNTVSEEVEDTKSDSIEEELTNAQKLKAAYPELNIGVEKPVEESWDEYDDDYDFDDDVELDRRHAALYGGDRMYCDCGEMLKHDEYGSYCPECDPKDPEDAYDD